VRAAGTTTTVERPLWLTLPGATRRAPLGWLGWLAAVAVFAPLVAEQVGPAGALLAVLAAGWVLGRNIPAPIEWLKRYHLDDAEVTVMGPGERVRRLPWAAVENLTQEPRHLALRGGGTTIRLPLVPLVARGAWGTVVTRVVPDIADEMWAAIEEGEEIRLAGAPEPSLASLVWWAWVPAVVCCTAGASLAGCLVGVAVAAGERAVALVRARRATVIMHRAGIELHRGAVFCSWPRAEVMRTPNGLLVGAPDGPSVRIPRGLPNFWAAAPVIELKALLGPGPGATVYFRVRMADGGLAVVGEVEPTA
jgi:hypothetical protein